ncbi:protein kinase domain protein [Ichthyophthirius multifiliis]|uniref:Protein kinase domain protein n=1 Tax=Ichthyophthirius multifiliis TaxID=5932 RepID=G0R540_ICHMU|nr:protein kinase domain protein [Ichthyophthirius multifiliis]EGR27442.1 protein kinase domain protein [Ichthyophthirius multifiliis]|eukprot:XP_004024352.1 protein kinase domain protein [Ichthyophthirius multifiliis]
MFKQKVERNRSTSYDIQYYEDYYQNYLGQEKQHQGFWEVFQGFATFFYYYLVISKSFFLKYREFKKIEKVCVLKIILFLVFIVKLFSIYVILIFPYNDLQDKNNFYFSIAIIQMCIYPFACILSPFYLIFWIVQEDEFQYGKYFALLNFMEIINSFIVFVLSIIEYLIYLEFNILKGSQTFYFVFNVFSGYLASLFILRIQKETSLFN